MGYCVKNNKITSLNERAHGALGCSPEEKVKGHSGAIYRGPLLVLDTIFRRRDLRMQPIRNF